MNQDYSPKICGNVDNETVFVLTGDGSAGLYSHKVRDIYHSSGGALAEAREKFVRPLNFAKNFNKKISENQTIRVLDICAGIGYNSKAFLDYLTKLPVLNRVKVEIDALEQNKQLVLLSPFINDGINDAGISYFLFKELSRQIFDDFALLQNIIQNPKNNPFLSQRTIALFEKYRFDTYCKYPSSRFGSFLHNIYYHYVSKRNKRALKPSNLANFSFKPYYGDARNFVKMTTTRYDIVFLDAFTPLKLPTLWTEEFFKKLYEITNDDSLIVTYSSSAAVRNAMKIAGFYVGKTFDRKNNPCGTIASKNINFIDYPLDEFDIGLLNTNAGVTFNDPELNWCAEMILEHYNSKKLRLNLQSSSSYIKSCKKKEEKPCMTQ